MKGAFARCTSQAVEGGEPAQLCISLNIFIESEIVKQL